MKNGSIRKLLKNRKLVRHVTVSILLLVLWLFLTVLFVVTFDTSFSIWSYNEANTEIVNLNHNLIYKGETFKGEFTAKDNNLGIVSVRFQTYIRPPYSLEDTFLFKLKQKDAKNWYYVNTYRSGLIYDVPFFPFGFPQIADSKGKAYEFELTSLNGNAVNAVSISSRYPILETKYKYSGHELLHNPKEMLKFLEIKFFNAFKTPDVVFSSFIYLLPFIFYLAWISFLEKLFAPLTNEIKRTLKNLENSPIGPVVKMFDRVFIYNLDYVLLFVVLVDIIIIQLNNDVVYLVITVLWILTLRVYKEKSKKSFAVGIFLIALCPLFLAMKDLPTAEQSGAWAFMFLVAGMTQIVFEEK